MAKPVGSKNRKPLGLDLDGGGVDIPAAALMPQPPEGGGALPVPSPDANDNPLASDRAGMNLAEKQIPVDPLAERRIRELEEQLATLQQRVTVSQRDNLEDLMKDPTFGTRSYLNVPVGTDPRTQKAIMAAISVFPDLVDPDEIDVRTKRPTFIAPDVGIARRDANVFRNSETVMIDVSLTTNFETNEDDIFHLSVKEAIKKKREEYLQKRMRGDKQHMRQLTMMK